MAPTFVLLEPRSDVPSLAARLGPRRSLRTCRLATRTRAFPPPPLPVAASLLSRGTRLAPHRNESPSRLRCWFTRLPSPCDRQWRGAISTPTGQRAAGDEREGENVDPRGSNLSSQARCSRCRREPHDDTDYVTWHALDEGAVCPGCLMMLETEARRASE
jgi:hypothetical protein